MLSPVLSGFWEQSQIPGEQSDGIQTQRLPRIPLSEYAWQSRDSLCVSADVKRADHQPVYGTNVPMVACVQGGDSGQTMTKKAMRNQTQQSFVSQNILLATLTVSDRHSWEWWVLFLSPKKHNRKQTQNRGGYCLTTGSAQPHGGECLRRGRCKVPLPVLPRVGLLHNRYLQEG